MNGEITPKNVIKLTDLIAQCDNDETVAEMVRHIEVYAPIAHFSEYEERKRWTLEYLRNIFPHFQLHELTGSEEAKYLYFSFTEDRDIFALIGIYSPAYEEGQLTDEEREIFAEPVPKFWPDSPDLRLVS